MKVKICANKTIEEAKMCLDAGADIIGVLVGQKHSSVDFVSLEQAKNICNFVNGRASVAVVTHHTDAEEIIAMTKYIGNDILQLHSNIEETEVEKIHKSLPYVKLIRLLQVAKDGEIVTNFQNMKFIDFFILDSFNLKTDQIGGTGMAYNWRSVKDVIKQLKYPVFVAGGLTPDNVKCAIFEAKPYGVDVNTGCKVNGKKDATKVREFVLNAKNC